MNKQEYLQYILDTYGVEPEYLWENAPTAYALRHANNRKWFGCGMTVSGKVLGFDSDATFDIIDLKADPLMIGSLRMTDGILPGYHMNKNHWLTVVLDGRTEDALLLQLTEESYRITAPKIKKKKP